jgi:hypothetical protein
MLHFYHPALTKVIIDGTIRCTAAAFRIIDASSGSSVDASPKLCCFTM